MSALSRRQCADGAVGESAAADIEDAIETRAIVLKGNGRGEFHQLGIRELPQQTTEQIVRDVRGRLDQFICQFQGDAFAKCESSAGGVVVEVEKLFFGDPLFSADGRIDVHSKYAADVRSRT